MALTVQTNMAAITALKNLNTNSSAMTKSLNRLSSGFRINSAADDASGFAVSSKLSAQTGRLKAASQNATQAQSMVKMADAGVNEIQNMVNRIQTLAIQASSANSNGERAKLDSERIKLESAINKIASSTNYNGVSLLSGTAGSAGASSFVSTFTAGTATGAVTDMRVVSLGRNADPNVTIGLGSNVDGSVFLTNGLGATTVVPGKISASAAFVKNGTATLTATDGTVVNITFGATKAGAVLGNSVGGEKLGKVVVTKGEKFVTSTVAATTTSGTNNAAMIGASIKTLGSALTGGTSSYTLVGPGVTTAVDKQFIMTIKQGSTIVGYATVGGKAGRAASSQDVKLTDGTTITITDSGVKTKADTGTGITLATLTSGKTSGGNGLLSFQVGANNNTSDQVNVDLSNSYSASSLGLGTGNLLSQSAAQNYVDTAKAALNTVVANRADLGSTQNQIAFIQANLATSIEQTIAAVSTIRDADMAAEMANFTKNKILTQAGTSMLAQANQAAQNVLTLFR